MKFFTATIAFIFVLSIHVFSISNDIHLRVPIQDIPCSHIVDENGLSLNIGRELLREIAYRENWTLEEFEVVYSDRKRLLNDDVLSIIPLTKLNSQNKYTNKVPILKGWASIVTLEGNTIKNRDQLNGTTVGVCPATVLTDFFTSFCTKNNLTPIVKEYDSLAELCSALEKKEVSSIVMGNRFPYCESYLPNFQQTTITFGAHLLGYEVSKQTPPVVLEKIDYYLSKWVKDYESPYYKLLDKHYDESTLELVNLDLPAHLDSWLKSSPVVDVYMSECVPLAYLNDSHFEGIVYDYFDRLAHSVGLKYRMHVLDTPGVYDNFEGDTCALLLCVSSEREFVNFVNTQPYHHLKYVLGIASDNYDTFGFSSIRGGRLLLGQGAMKIKELQNDFPNLELHTTPYFEDIFKKIKDNEFEAAYIPELIAEYHSRTVRSEGVKYFASKRDYGCDLSFGVHSSQPELLHLMNLLIKNSNPDLFQQIIFENKLGYRKQSLSTTEKILIVLVLLIFLLIIVVFFLIRQSQIRKKLDWSNRQLSRTEKLAKTGVIVLNISKGVIELSESFSKRLGYDTKTSFDYDDLINSCVEEQNDRQRDRIRLFLQGDLLTGLFCFKSSGGDIVWLRVQMDQEGKNSNGDKIRHGAIQDITLQKQQEEERLRSESRFRSIYEDSPIGVLYIEKEGEELKLNNSARLLLKANDTHIPSISDFLNDLLLTKENREAISNRESISFVSTTKTNKRYIASHVLQLGFSIRFSESFNKTPFLIVMISNQTFDFQSQRKIVEQRDIMYKVSKEVNLSFWTANLMDTNGTGILGYYLKYLFKDESVLVSDIFQNSTVRDLRLAEINIQKILDGESQKGYHELLLNKEEGVRIVLFSWNIVQYAPEEGKVIIHGIEHDVTEQRLSQKGFELAQNSARLGSWVMNLGRRSVDLSQGFMSLFSLDREKNSKENFAQIMSNIVDRRKVLFRFYHGVYSSTKKFKFKFSIKSDLGEERIMQCFVSLLDEYSPDVLVFGVVQDVTDRTTAIRNLIETKNQLSAILKSISSIVIFVSKDLELIWANEGAHELVDFTTKEGRCCYHLRFGKTAPCKVCGVLEAMRNKKVIKQEIKFENGRTYNATFVPNYDVSGEPIGCVETFDEITEIKEKETELLRSKEKAEESDRLKSSFLANLSHEIRSPLSNISGFTSLIMNPKYSDKQKKEFMSLIEYNQTHLLELIDDVLELSKIEARAIQIDIENVDVDSVCVSLVKSLSVDLKNNVELAYIPFTDSMHIHTDRMKLIQVLRNLISNAKKFTSKGGIWLYVDDCSDLGEIEFRVSDTGVGIAPKYQKAIFNRFEKGQSKQKGTGLGLSICQAIVTCLGGTIRVESEENKGATFIVSIPKYREITPVQSSTSDLGQGDTQTTLSFPDTNGEASC